ncbi:MAG: methyltransferase domain-containing protein [Candidatus Poribacteria bacterium]|nr:methyltransferase domain-containing protein [Candidatus Poribacteria bacterium]MDE0504471.1 methyltransferase domain-containing protein [Candidatus Poribacteria bacterium]
MPSKRYFYLTNIPDLDAEIINAECLALTGSAPDSHGLAVSLACTDVRRGAYVRSCAELLFEGGSISDICAKIRAADLYADDFRVSVVKLPRNLEVNSLRIAHELGAEIGGRPDLDRPRVKFLTVIKGEKILFGKLLSESDGRWVAHNSRPHVTSSSLPTRLARAIVNLTASLGDRILDPCCGTGTIILEAAQMGMIAVGYDINVRMVGATRKNLDHYGLSAEVCLGDARQISGRFDAVITDFPYGIGLAKDPTVDREILRRIRQLAPRAAFVHTRDLSSELVDIGYFIERVVPVRKHTMVRKIFIASTRNDPGWG